MKVDWSLVLTLVCALFLSAVINRVALPWLLGSSATAAGSSSTVLNSQATGDWLDEFLAVNHPDIKR